MPKTLWIMLALVVLGSAPAASADGTDISTTGGTFLASASGLSFDRDVMTKFGAINGSNLGTVDFTTGALVSGSLSRGNVAFGGGGSFTIIGNGTMGLPNGVIFAGTFSSLVTGTFHLGSSTYTFEGDVTGKDEVTGSDGTAAITSLFGQSFVELQFYPDAIVQSCSQDGGFQVKFAPNTFTVCSPVFRLTSTGQKGKFHETAAFNAMLTDGSGPNEPLIMHAGDTVTVHWFITPAADGFHVTVTDLTTGGSGTIVLNSGDSGPLMPAFSMQQIGNALGWGAVFDTPNAFVWEIGHESIFTGKGALCVGGQVGCDSYNAANWAGITPIQILSVTFANGSNAKEWAVVSDLGGLAEFAGLCADGAPFCIYPWYSLSTNGFNFGVDYPGTIKDFGQSNQYQQMPLCGGPFGTDSTFCDTVLK